MINQLDVTIGLLGFPKVLVELQIVIRIMNRAWLAHVADRRTAVQEVQTPDPTSLRVSKITEENVQSSL